MKLHVLYCMNDSSDILDEGLKVGICDLFTNINKMIIVPRDQMQSYRYYIIDIYASFQITKVNKEKHVHII